MGFRGIGLRPGAAANRRVADNAECCKRYGRGLKVIGSPRPTIDMSNIRRKLAQVPVMTLAKKVHCWPTGHPPLFFLVLELEVRRQLLLYLRRNLGMPGELDAVSALAASQ